MKTLVILLGAILLCESGFGAVSENYYYSEKQGPETWGRTYPACNGKSQSPINIPDFLWWGRRHLKKLSASPLKLEGYDHKKPKAMTLINNGQTLEVKLQGKLLIKGGGLDGTYRAQQLHFHWGTAGILASGSEHTINKRGFPLEMHIVHYNTKYRPSQASKHKDGLAVLAVLFTRSVFKDNAALNKILNAVNKVEKSGSEVAIKQFPVGELLPSNVKSFYRYQGSLTTPPCTENVAWTVFKTYSTVSLSQLKIFRKLKNKVGGVLADNYRPTRKLNGRTIWTA